MLCKVCGSQIPDNSVKCEFCGADTGIAAVSEEAIDETKVIDAEEIKNIEQQDIDEMKDEKEEIFDDNERRRQEQMQRMMENKKKQLSEIERRRNEKRAKQKRARIALVALVCAAVVAAAGCGIYYMAQNVNTQDSVALTASPSPTIAIATPTPSVIPTPTVSPELSMTTAPKDASTAAPSNQSWSSTGNSASGTSSSSNKASSGAGSSSNKTASTPGGSQSANTGSSSSGNASSTGNIGTVVANAAASGVSKAYITSQLSVGDEVIYNQGTGRYLMTFVTGNVKYYANVSEGSTTEQIHHKPYTITAAPTDETYNGNTVYEISVMTNYSGNEYILPDSGTKLLTDSDIKGLSKNDLALARNEIFARHGRKFQTAVFRDFFTAKSWYKLNPSYNYSDDNSNLNSIEKQNVQFLLNAERK